MATVSVKRSIVDQANFFFLKTEARRIRILLDYNTERHKLTRNIGI